MSATPDSTLANPEQLITDLQRQLAEREAELAECKAERDEALQRETATAEVLGVINSSPGDLAPVFEAILEKAHSFCGAASGALVTYDDGWFRAIATRGMPECFAEHMRRGFPFTPDALQSSWCAGSTSTSWICRRLQRTAPQSSLVCSCKLSNSPAPAQS